GVPTPTFSTTSGNSVTANFFGAGPYTFRVIVTDSFGLSSYKDVNVTVQQTPTSVTVTSQSPSVTVGLTDQFTATVFDQFGTPLAAQPSQSSFTWQVTSGPGTGTIPSSISSSGLYTAPGINGNNQKAVIKASYQYTDSSGKIIPISGSTTVTVKKH